MIALARVLADSPNRLLDTLVDAVIRLCGADSAVVTLVEPGEGPGGISRWRAAGGVLADRRGLATPLGDCPSAAVLESDTPALLKVPTTGWPTSDDPAPPVVEALAAPLKMRGKTIGAVWAVLHRSDRAFDAEDVRRLDSVARFAATGHQAIAVQADLRASEARFRALVTCPGPIVFRTALDGAILEAPGWEGLTGQPPSQHLGWGWLDAVHPDDRETSVAAWTRSLKTGEPTYMDYRLRDASGAWRWVSGYGAPVRDDAGEIVEWMGTVSDIHELKEAKAALVENESYHRFAAEAGRTGSWYMRLDTGETVLSPMAADLFGLPGEQTTWQAGAWDAYVAAEDREPLRRAVVAAVHGDAPFDVEFRIRLDSGEERWLYSRGGVARDPSGKALRLHGATVDMSERKAAQARRLAIVELADRLRDLEDPAEITRVALDIAGRTVSADWAVFGAYDPLAQSVAVTEGWTAPEGPALPSTLPFAPYDAYRRELARGEPVAAADADESGGALAIYQPLTAQPGPLWVFIVHGAAPRVWAEEDLAFIREAAERTRVAVERRRAEQSLRERAQGLEREVEARTAEWSRLWRNSRDLLLVMDRGGTFRAANPAWTTILGWLPEEVVGRDFAAFAHPDDQAETSALWAGAASVGAPSFETRHRHKDGGYRWVSWVAAPENDLIYATGRHITAEREAAEALEQTQTRLRTFFETSYQYRALVSLEGLLLEANATALKAVEAERQSVVGKPIWETPWFTHTKGIPEALRAVVPSVAKGEVRREDILLQLPSSGPRWLDFTLRPLEDSRGQTVAIVLEAVDITERRETEAALRQSQKLEAMGQLTGGVAHDFNNLLTPIIGGLDILLRRGQAGDREARLIGGALQSAERAKTLVQRLLAFARRQPLQTGPVDVEALVVGIKDLVASTAGPRIALEVELEDGLPPAQADANQLEMAILNLSVNARDAMPDGGRLTLAAAREQIDHVHKTGLRPGDYIRLTVADTGTGMDEATLGRAIEPFFSTKGQGRGTGLGLSMAHGLASQLGGALRISSKPLVGTTVELWLPISIEARTAPPPPGTTRTSPSRTGVVLLVDDEAPARLTTAQMLADLGYEVLEAASAEEALTLLETGRSADILVTDHLMPGMTGAELARVALERFPDLPILIVTGYADSLPVTLPHLSKPFRQSDLAASLSAVVRATS